MKTRITDSDALRLITPEALRAFVCAEGWTKAEAYGLHADIYQKDGYSEIILPRTDDLVDYVSAVSQLISKLSEYGDGDELSIYTDLIESDHDCVRVRAARSAADGSIGLNSAIDLISGTRSMLFAAACSTQNPQAVYGSRVTKEVSDYMESVSLRQAGHGDFVLTLLTPVFLPLQDTLGSSGVNEAVGRRVTTRFTEALGASREAVDLFKSDNAKKMLEGSISKGVSANMCEAILNLIQQLNEIEISFHWASIHPCSLPHKKIKFTKNDEEILQKIIEIFRNLKPRSEVEIHGTVFETGHEPDSIEKAG